MRAGEGYGVGAQLLGVRMQHRNVVMSQCSAKEITRRPFKPRGQDPVEFSTACEASYLE